MNKYDEIDEKSINMSILIINIKKYCYLIKVG